MASFKPAQPHGERERTIAVVELRLYYCVLEKSINSFLALLQYLIFKL